MVVVCTWVMAGKLVIRPRLECEMPGAWMQPDLEDDSVIKSQDRILLSSANLWIL
jgi:hypothetical protein